MSFTMARRVRAVKDANYDEQRAWRYLLWLVGRRDYTRQQLQSKLREKSVIGKMSERLLDELERLNFIDDLRFAERYVAQRQHKKGVHALRRELLRKGIASELVENSLHHLDESSQLHSAAEVLSSYSYRLKAEDGVAKNRAKAYGVLTRRGFPGSIVQAVLEQTPMFDDDSNDT